MASEVSIPKTWRSEFFLLASYIILTVSAVFLSRLLPWTVLQGYLFTINGVDFFLKLPVLLLFPIGLILTAIYRIYNVQYLLSKTGVEYFGGLLWVNKTMFKVRYEDIVGIETKQTLLERMLNVGDILIGTAATGGVEIQLEGISSPFTVQQVIQDERSRRLERGGVETDRTKID
jgi:uncharacterized membrane protein YdbT with pleckstrin-like domain